MRDQSFIGRLCAVLALATLGGCASVGVQQRSVQEFINERRSDVLSNGALSIGSSRDLQETGLDVPRCQAEPKECIDALGSSPPLGLIGDRSATLAELWTARSLQLETQAGGVTAAPSEPVVEAWLQAARYAYAALFANDGQALPGGAFQSRRLQVRDFYNLGTQRIARMHYRVYAEDPSMRASPQLAQIRLVMAQRDGRPWPVPKELVSSTELNFDTVRALHRRDGLGANFVAILPVDAVDKDPQIVEPGYAAVTVLLRFDGSTTAQILAGPRPTLQVIDSRRSDTVQVNGQTVSMSADFSSPFALWMTRSDFDRNAIGSMLGLGESLSRPMLYMLEPFDRERRVLILLHGLASSPQTWLNVANNVLGDDAIRHGYQIWLLRYPTQNSIGLNRLAIDRLLRRALAEVDPAHDSLATNNIVLAGHSMGGVLSRLLVSNSGERMWDALTNDGTPPTAVQRAELGMLAPYLEFSALPGVRRAVFLAAPHRGTTVADGWLAGFASNWLSLPSADERELRSNFSEAQRVLGVRSALDPRRVFTSISELSEQNAWMRQARELPLAPGVRFNSIIGRNRESDALAQSTDGFVPYASSHLAGAESELVLTSDHSVHQQAKAMLELRRILREELKRPPATGP